jgi:heparosan-N-sulfate-glucuronate 5-epimerase
MTAAVEIARKALKASFSIGDHYEPQPPNTRFTESAVRGYPLDLTAKTLAATASAPESLQPAAFAQLALGWWERWLCGEPGAREEFERLVAALEHRAERHECGLLWPYDVAIPKHGVDPPWYSAMAQGQAASVFVRAFMATRDERFGSLALDAVRPLFEEASHFVASSEYGPILEEGASQPGLPAPTSHILNGWVYALWGLWDVQVGLGDTAAATLFTQSVACLRNMLERYDTGWWTRYDLNLHPIPHLAKPFYHRLHVNQTAMMYRLTAYDEFADFSERWRRYDEPVRRTLAIAQKAAFELSLAISKR